MAVRKKAAVAAHAAKDAAEEAGKEAVEVTKDATTKAAAKTKKVVKTTKPRRHKDGKRVTRVVITEVRRLPYEEGWAGSNLAEAGEQVAASAFNGLTREELVRLVGETQEEVEDAEKRWEEVLEWEEPYSEEQAFQMAAAWGDLRQAQQTHAVWRSQLNRFDDLARNYMLHGWEPDHDKKT